jgi:hypothetical protein
MIENKYSEFIADTMQQFYNTLSEKSKRHYAAVETIKFGHGGQKYIAEILGCEADTIRKGLKELFSPDFEDTGRVRAPGAGPKKIIETTENIDEVFLSIIHQFTAGSPMEGTLWTNLSLVAISNKFKKRGIDISPFVVDQLMKRHHMGHRKMRKTVTLEEHADRNEQFEKIHSLRSEYKNSENPIISIDVKKKNK